MRLTNTAEGGTDTATVTTGNSGGVSGDAWDQVVIGGTSTLTYSDTQVAHGDLAYEVAADGANGVYLVWDTSLTTTSEHYGRVYLYLSANPSSNLVLVQGRGTAGQAFRIIVTTSGILSLRNASSVEVATSTTAVSTGQWIRLEWHAEITSGTTGDLTVRLFNDNEALLSTETVTATGLTMQTELNTIRIGDFNGTTTAAFYLDNIDVNDIAFAGPSDPSGDIIYATDLPETGYAADDTQQLNLTNTATYATGTPEVSVTFLAPASGQVVITVGGSLRDNGATSDERVFLSPRVLDHRDTEILAPSVTFRGFGSVGETAEFMYSSRSSLLTGLAPGGLHTATVMHIVTAGSTADINHREISVVPMP